MKYTEEYWKDVKTASEHVVNKEKLYGSTILITGATGMICSSVVDIISSMNRKNDAGIRLILAGRSRQRTEIRFRDVLDENEYEFAEYDAVRNEPLDLKTDYIIHGASNANPAAFVKEPVETLLSNIAGLNTVLNTARVNQNCRVLYISSSEVYGNRQNGTNTPYKEEEYGYVDILNPRSCYPNGKRAAETLCASYIKEYGTDTVIVRPGHIYGPSITDSDTRASAAFTRDAVNGRDIVMKSAGAQIRSYCYTLDCASAILTVLTSGETGEAYNISNKNSVVSIRDLAEELASCGNVNLVFENPSDVEKTGYNLMSNSALNAEKLENLGWQAVFDLHDGVMKTIREY